MLQTLKSRLHKLERLYTRGWGTDISTPKARRTAWLHFYLSDHAIVRILWTNLYQIAPDVWRSNQPSPAQLRKLKAMGIKTILNLRGEDVFSFHLFERETCDELGLELINLKIYARSLATREKYLELFEIFDRIEKPFLMHCKSGADRAGLASALWLMDKEGASIEDAKKMMSFKYMHVRFGKTGLMDHVLNAYEADNKDDPMPVRQWFAEKFDNQALTASYNALRSR